MQNQDDSPTRSKILDHDAGIGEVSDDEITKRARELSMIAGRLPEEFNEGDRQQALEELRGHRDQLQAADQPPFAANLTERDDTLGSGGATTPAASPQDGEQTIGEALYNEGVAEATHDQMVESRRGELLDHQALEDDSTR